MKITIDISGDYPDGITTYFNFQNYVGKYEHLSDTSLSIGFNSVYNKEVHNHIKDCKIKMFLNTEHPCTFYGKKEDGLLTSDINNNFTDVFTICPYSTDWINNLHQGGSNKFKFDFFPIDKVNALKFDCEEKTIDSIFHGSICGKAHENTIRAISDFNYRFVTLGPDYWHPNEDIDTNFLYSKVTNMAITTAQKWHILSKTKTIPIQNQLYMKEGQIDNIKQHQDWELNKAFEGVEETNIICQIKPRVVEAAFFKVLMLVKKDNWNAIEFLYEPEKEFLYYDDEKDLPDMISEITKNWENYKHIVDNAYNRAMKEYTTEATLARMVSSLGTK
jgi:hypothetical protein